MSYTPIVLTTWAILKAERGQAKVASSGITDKYMRESGETGKKKAVAYGKGLKAYRM